MIQIKLTMAGFGHNQLYDALRKGGLFISDDIECNSALEFATSNNLDYFVVKFEGRYVGVIKK